MRSPAPLIAIGALLLSACSTTTLNEDECRMVDWRTLGYEDGVAGHSGERISAHRKACAEHGIRPACGSTASPTTATAPGPAGPSTTTAARRTSPRGSSWPTNPVGSSTSASAA